MKNPPRPWIRRISKKREAERKASGEKFIRSSVRPSQGAGSSVKKGSKPAKPRKKVKPVNRARREREFARCYGSKERVAFVKAMPCIYCVALLPILAESDRMPPSDNAHTENGGKGRKGHYTTIVPLDRRHHEWYDQHRGPFADPAIRAAIKAAAIRTEAAWQDHLNRGNAP